MGAVDGNSGPHAGFTSTLPIEPTFLPVCYNAILNSCDKTVTKTYVERIGFFWGEGRLYIQVIIHH